MAILRNREVIYLGTANATDVTPTVRVQDTDGNIEFCKLTELRFTEDEKTDLLKVEENRIDGYNVISNKELKDLRDSKDPEQAEALAERQRVENKKPKPVVRPVVETQVYPMVNTPVKPDNQATRQQAQNRKAF